MRKIRESKKPGIAFFQVLLMLLIFLGAAAVSIVDGATPSKKPVMRQQQQDVIYRYNPQGRIDPFTPLIRPEVAAKKKNEKSRVLPLNPLQRLGIEQFRLVGIVEGEQGRRAMVQDPSGRFYSLIKGASIGLYNGMVESILKDSVIVHEKYVTDEGKIKPRKQIMKLRQNEVTP